MQNETPDGLHVAIIMDGNGRWATRRSLPRVAGHRAGLAAARRIVEHAPDIGIRRLTLYAFSSDNWRRPAAEVQSIFWLLRAFLRLETDRLREQGARLEMIGRRDRLPAPVLEAIEKTERATASGRRLHLCVAIDYSSRDAITRAAAIAVSQLKPADPRSPDSFAAHFTQSLTKHNAEVDLLIRPGRRKAPLRLSPLGVRLRRAPFHPMHVARFHRSRSRCCSRRLPPPPPPLSRAAVSPSRTIF